MKTRIKAVMAAGFLMMLGATAANASIIVTAVETGGDVVFSGGGTANLDGLTYSFTSGCGGGISPAGGILAMCGASTDVYDGLDASFTFGSGGATFLDSWLGDTILVQGTQIGFDAGYVSNTDISGSMTFFSATFASLGLTEGTYVWTWGEGDNADSLTLNIGPVDTPEPTSLALLGLGLVGLGMRRRMKA